MPTLLQQRALNDTVGQYIESYGLPPHNAFLYMVIEKYLSGLDLNDIEIEEAIIDGPNDCGIDAIVIDDEAELRPNVYFFQSKYFSSDDAFARQFDGAALEKIRTAIDDFVLQGKINERYQNRQLIDRLHSVKNLGGQNPKYIIVLCSNSKEPSAAAKSRLEEFISDANRKAAGEYLAVEYLHLERIAEELIAPRQRRRIDLKMQISGRYLTEDTGDVRLFVGAIEGSDLATLVEKYEDDLFERNVRGDLRQVNQVNKAIHKTATSDRSPYFIYMNNGLTITCRRFHFSPRQDSPLLEIENAQIVNGQQTARALHQASKSNDLKDDVKVLVRIVEAVDTDLLMQIVESTNTQTRVTSRDLRSNDDIQKLIEESLRTRGYFYEARKNKYKGREASRRVDAEIAAQAYYAIFVEQPAIAKDRKKLLFGEKYEEIFNDDIDPANLLYCFKIVKLIQFLNKKAEYLAKFTFLKDATLHTAALMHKLSVEEIGTLIDLDKANEIEKKYKKATKALSTLVKERSAKEGDKYEHRRTFKDAETYGRAVEIMLGAK